MKEIHPEGWPILLEEDRQRVLDCFDSGRFWSGNGHYVSDLEAEFASWTGAKHALAVTNGTHALEIALAAAGIGHGNEVLVPAFTFMSSASAVLMRNALPIPVDVDPQTFCLDTSKLSGAVTPNTRAIMPVHMSGNACDMHAIMSFAKSHKLSVIEDCAHCLGSEYSKSSSPDLNVSLGTIGDVGCFTFQASKVVVGGEGGMIITDNTDLYHRALSFSNYGWVPNGVPYGHFMLGSNYRMPELTAALVIGQLERVHQLAALRELTVLSFEERLKEFSSIRYQRRKDTKYHGHFYFVLIIDGLTQIRRDLLVSKLVEQNIPARRNYPAFQQTPLFLNFKQNCPQFSAMGQSINYGEFHTPVAETIADSGFWLPHWMFLSDEGRLEQVIQIFSEFGIE